MKNLIVWKAIDMEDTFQVKYLVRSLLGSIWNEVNS